jgi:hypothetical protein
MKSAIPWILVVALLANVFFLYSANRDKEAQLAKVTQDSADVDGLRQQIEDLKKQAGSPGDGTQAHKDSDELLRLRSEVQRLRDENKLLTTQLTTARSQASQAQQAQQQAAQVPVEQSFRGQSQPLTQNPALVEAHNHNVCVHNLRLIDGAKQQWALEFKKMPEDVPTAENLNPYLPKDVAIVCPSGGTYSINAVSVPPTCTVAGHELSPPP